jgi:hypothetical protein
MPPKKKGTATAGKKKKSKVAEEEDVEDPPVAKKKSTKPKTASEAFDAYDQAVNTSGSQSRQFRSAASKLEMGIGGKFLKFLVLLLNVFYVLIGFVLMVYGAWYYNTDSSTDFTGKAWTPFVIILGIFIMIVGIIGLLGAKYQNRLILVFYFIVVVILFILTLACGAWVLTLQGSEAALVRSGWKNAPVVVRSTVQTSYNCCGLDQFNVTVDPADKCNPLPAGQTTGDTCLQFLVDIVQKYYSSFGALILIVCATLLVNIFITWFLFKVLNRMAAQGVKS